MNENKKKILQICLKILLYAVTVVAAAFGVSSLSSCSVASNVSNDIKGRAVIVTSDTTVVNHSGFLEFKKR